MTAIGIDMGTTTISGVVYEKESERGSVSEAVTVPHNGFVKGAHEWERIQDAEKMTGQAITLLDQLLERYPHASSIGLTGQMHGILYLDREGKCLSPLYTWQDGRGNLPGFGRTGEETLVDFIRERAGLIDTVGYGVAGGQEEPQSPHFDVFSGYGLVTHLYHQYQGTVPRGTASLCTVADYLGMLLTGRKEPLLHVSNGAGLGFFDGRSGRFCREVLQDLGMELSLLPEVTEGLGLLGYYRGIPVSISIGDSQASFLGSVGLKENTALLNVGTGGQISLLSKVYFQAPGIEARPFPGGSYLLTGASLCGGRAWAILERFLRGYVREAGGGEESQYEIMGRLAMAELERRGSQERADECMKVTTTFSGTRTEPDQRGSITDISEDNFTPQGLAYGVLEGLAGELYDLYRIIREGTGIRAERLVASGNGVRKNAALQRIFGQMFGAELRLSPYQEEAACGAALGSMEYCHR